MFTVEAQGRGSLHPHILVWLTLLCLQEILEQLLRDRASFRQRLRRWMQELVQAVLSVQHTSVARFPRLLRGREGAAADAQSPLPDLLRG